MEWVETTGRTLEEAIDVALDQLGVDEDEAEFEVLEEPRGGFLGRLRSQARVRARVRPAVPRPKDDRRDRRRRTRDRDRRAGSASTSGAGGGAREAAAGRGAVEDIGSESPAGDRPEDVAEAKGDPDVEDDLSVAEQGELVRDFVAGLVEAFDVDAQVNVREVDEEGVEVTVEGKDLGLLIGPRGQTLGSIQELARTVVQRQVTGHHARIVVDVAGYRQRRKEALERFVRQLAAEVVSSGQSRVLEPMTPPDRKIVHDAVNEIDGVATTSEGEEPNRRVVIVPEAGRD